MLEYRCGALRFTEWKGFWKAAPNVPRVSKDEWFGAWESLRNWLSQRYLVDWKIEWQRHCWVEDVPYGELIDGQIERERLLKIDIEVADILTVPFLKFVQQWLLQKAALYRVSVPVDDTHENLILIYPQAIRINPEAEADLEQFVQTFRPRLAARIEAGFRETGRRRKPIPPLP